MPRNSATKLSEDKHELKQSLLKQIPIGTRIGSVETYMKGLGFECSHERDESGDFLYCDRQEPTNDFIDVRWQILVYYKKSVSTRIEVNIGYIGL